MKTINAKNERIATTQPGGAVPTRRRTRTSSRANWLVPTALIALTAIPSLTGILALVGLAEGTQITPDDARFAAMPLPIVIHILSALPFCILGAFQFAPGIRRRWPRWHRLSGRLVVPCGLAAGLSGMWMAQFYLFSSQFQSHLLYGFRMFFGSAMVLSIALGLIAILRRDITRHRAWMIRGYAIGQGASSQALTGLLWVLIFGTQGQPSKDLLMGASWGINLLVAEWIIRRKSFRRLFNSTSAERNCVKRGNTQKA